MDGQMRSLPIAVILASLAVSFGGPASAADLDYLYRVPQVQERALPDYEEHRAHVYTRPVVGFYAYPNDHLIDDPGPYRGVTPEPYVLRRDAPHGIMQVR